MNIVKFKDVMIEGEDLERLEKAELFNELYRGKYCYCVNWKWCILMEDIDNTEFIRYSVTDAVPADIDFLDLELYTDYVDREATEKVNRMDAYILSNNYIPSDFTLDQIKKFRTFVASALLANSQLWDDEYDATITDKITHMLLYYKNGMWDTVIKMLASFSDYTSGISLSGTYTDCGCGGTTAAGTIKDSAGIYKTQTGCGCSSANAALLLTNTCDCTELYRTSIRNFMIDVFSDWKFWDRVSEIVVPDMIAMLKAILEAGLPLSFTTTDVVYGDCSCMNNNTDETGKIIVANLIKALEYIRDEAVVAHKNFIKNSLYAWASKLYERMEW